MYAKENKTKQFFSTKFLSVNSSARIISARKLPPDAAKVGTYVLARVDQAEE